MQTELKCTAIKVFHKKIACIPMLSLREFLWGVLFTILATIGLGLILYSIKRLYPKLVTLIERSEGRYIRSVKFRGIELLNVKSIMHVVLWMAHIAKLMTIVLSLYIYIPLVLSFFPRTSNLAPKLMSYITDPLKKVFGFILEFIPNVFFIIIIVLVTRFLLHLTFFFFHNIDIGRLKFRGFHKDWAIPTYKLTRIFILAMALVMIFPYLPGSSSPAFQGISVFFGVLISLGSSSAVANGVGGVVITYMRPYKVGDIVKISDTMGKVIEKNLLVTRIRTIKNVEVTIPNSMVLSSHMINYSVESEMNGLILNTSVTIGYNVPWRQVHKLLKAAALKTKYITTEREPFVLQTALNDYHISYELNAVTSEPNQMVYIYSELHQNIQDTFNEAGVEIMSPQYTAYRDGNESTVAFIKKEDDSVSRLS